MTDEERDAFLHGSKIMNIATVGADGRVHLVAMWFGFVDGQLAFWTYGKSQKIVNLERDPRITGLVESGDGVYNELRGVELVGTARIVRDDRRVIDAVGESVWERYTGPVDDAARQALAVVGAKRVAVVIDVDKWVTWDHTKLAGAY
jgi:PPOX class probable F420-dependent enzyme